MSSPAIVVAGTGHRPDKLGGYGSDISTALVDLAVRGLSDHAPTRVISGMALGWDQALTEAATQLQIPWVAAVPFTGQESRWPKDSQARYRALLAQASESITISPGGYSPWKMQVRNRWMVDRCDLVLALWNGTSGGTARCIEYAADRGRPVVNLWDTWTAGLHVRSIFVFGSNTSGRHGKGAALFARQHHGAVYGQGEGLQGTSYAIPTKDERLQTLSLDSIQTYVNRFLDFAHAHTEMTFVITRIGCGLAGYSDADIAPLFAGAPENCHLPEGWRTIENTAQARTLRS